MNKVPVNAVKENVDQVNAVVKPGIGIQLNSASE